MSKLEEVSDDEEEVEKESDIIENLKIQLKRMEESVRDDKMREIKAREIDYREISFHPVEGKLGSGASGSLIFKAVWNGSGGGIPVAIKEVTVQLTEFDDPPNRSTFFDLECKTSKDHLRHPMFVQIYGIAFPGTSLNPVDVEETFTKYWVVRELLDGDVKSLVFEGKLSMKKKIDVMYKMTQCVNYLHSLRDGKGMIHRDIKAMNFLYRRKGSEVKIADFGICRMPSGDFDFTTTEGTWMWNGPEVETGIAFSYSKLTDIWSLGMTFYEVLFGRDPWSKKQEISRMNPDTPNLGRELIQMKMENGSKPFVEDYKGPKWLFELMVKCWGTWESNDSKLRWKSCEEILEEFRKNMKKKK